LIRFHIISYIEVDETLKKNDLNNYSSGYRIASDKTNVRIKLKVKTKTVR
jgi:hypothetical protein